MKKGCSTHEYNFAADVLQEFCAELLAGTEFLEEAELGRVLVDTSLDGIDTHGTAVSPICLTRLQNGRINVKPQIKITQTAPVLLS